MLKVKSLIEKEMDLDEAVEENNRAFLDFINCLQEISKKKPENIRYILCGNNA